MAGPHLVGAVSFADATEAPAVPPDGEHGQEWGAVIHQLLELAMKSPGADLERLASTSLPEHGLSADRAADAASVVRAVMQSEIWRRAVKSPRYFTEVPFQILKDQGVPAPTVLRGAIDLIFKEDEGWVLVDYKTDRIPAGQPEALVEKYAPQLQLYARAWQECTGERVKEMGLFFSQMKKFIAIRAD